MEEHLKRYTLAQIEAQYRQGMIAQLDLDEYLAAWNGTRGRFTHAYWRDGAIRQHDIERRDFACAFCVAPLALQSLGRLATEGGVTR